MKTFFTRTGTALIFLIIMLGGLLSNSYTFIGLMVIILAASALEYFNITAIKRGSRDWDKIITTLLLIAYFISAYYISIDQYSFVFTAIVPALVFILFALALFTHSENPFSDVGWNVLPVLWLYVPLVQATKIYFDNGGLFLLSIFALIWIYDSGSYIFGSLFGRTKLFERISPKKTWEGSTGGALVTIAIAFFMNRIPQLSGVSSTKWMILAAVVIVSGTMGDLFESLLKRSLNVKDSGSIMPGHGGFLDRFDAFFFLVPFVTLALWLMDSFHC